MRILFELTFCSTSEANPIVIVGKKSIVLDKEIRDLGNLADLVAERDKLGSSRRKPTAIPITY